MSPEALTGIELSRRQRSIETFVTDYLPDDEKMSYDGRVGFYRLLKNGLGIDSVRTEFRMKRLIQPDRTFNEATASVYVDSLRAMKEAGLGEPTLVLFTPAKWMEKEAAESPDHFLELYRSYTERIKSLCQVAGSTPKYIQVMNEINTHWQTGTSFDRVIDMIMITREVFSHDFPNTKIMTTVLTVPAKGWKEFTAKLVERTGNNLQAIGFDYYPGIYENPAGVPLIGKPPFEAFGGTTPYDWIADQKSEGILKDKDVILAETGATALSSVSRFQQFGYDRIVQSLDHFLLGREREGQNDTFAAVGFFTGGHHEAVDTKTPGGFLDFKPWTLVRKNKLGEWTLTNAGSRLKHLIQTRLHSEQA